MRGENHMQMIPVKSNDLKSVGYDADKKIMLIDFVKGGLYQYKNITTLLHNQLMSAPSKGKFFNANIRSKPQYPCIKINS